MDLLELNINGDHPKDGIITLLKKVKPSWDHNNIKIEPLTGGYSSKIFRCYVDGDEDESVTVRINNLEGTTNFKFKQHKFEVKMLKALSSYGHFSQFYAGFQNGYCYEFIKGKAVVNAKTQNGTITVEIVRHIANEFAYLHSVKLDDVEYIESRYFQNLKLLGENLKYESYISKEVLLNEYARIEEYFKTLNSPLVHCHGDPHPGNFVWNEQEKKITFVDWEMTNVGYQHQEVAHFLATLWIYDITNKTNKGVVILPQDIENEFLKQYFESCCIIRNEKYTEQNYLTFKDLIEKFKFGPWLFFITISVLFPEITQEFSGDKNFFMERSVQEYLKLKQVVFGSGKFGK